LWVSGSFVVDASQYKQDLPDTVASVVDGQFTAKLETIYKDRLPYRLAATDLVGAARYLVFGEGRKGVVVGQGGWLFSSEEYRVADNETQRIDDAVRAIAAVRDQLATSGTELVVVPLPAKADIYREHTAYPSLSDAMTVRYDRFRQALAAQEVKTVDARAALLADKVKEQVFLKGDTHWSQQGAAAVADATAQAVGPVIAPVPITLAQGDTMTIEGDLTKFIISPRYASYVSLVPEQVTLLRASTTQPSDVSAVDIFGAQPIGVALVGTSYSANVNWSFAASLMAALGADVVNFAEEGHGPFVPMQQFLSSEALNTAPPKLVIWEIPVRYLTDPEALVVMTAKAE
ncbi:MAG: hypothetical protein ABI414_11610, partial [Devosia sp.]